MASIGETSVQLSLDSSRFTTGIKNAQDKWQGFSGALMKMADFSKFAQGIDFSRFEKGNAIFEGVLFGAETLGGLGGPWGAAGQVLEGILNTFKDKTPIEEAFGPDKQAMIDRIAAATKNAENDTQRYAIALRMAGEEGMKLAAHLNRATPAPMSVEESKLKGLMPKDLDWEWFKKNWPAADVENMGRQWQVDTPGQEAQRFRAQREEAIQQQAREQNAREDRIKAINSETNAMLQAAQFENKNRDKTPREKEFQKQLDKINSEGGALAPLFELRGLMKESDRTDRLKSIMGGDDKTRFEKMRDDADFFQQQFRAGNVSAKKFQEVMNQQIAGLGDTPRASIPGASGGIGFSSREAVNAIIDATTRESPARDRIQEQQLREQRDMRRHLEDIRNNTQPVNKAPAVKAANF